jgi:hypothetical protein
VLTVGGRSCGWFSPTGARLLKLEPELSQLRRGSAIEFLPSRSLLLVSRWYSLSAIAQHFFHNKVHDCLVFAISHVSDSRQALH